MKKKVLLIVLTMACCGFAMNAHAQDFWNAIQQAANAVNSAVNAGQNVSNAINPPQQSTPSPSYTRLGSVRAIRFNSNTTVYTSFDVVKTSSGDYRVLKNGNLYSIYENSSYNVYCSDPKDSRYYKYYINSGGAYYFNW